MEEDDDDDDDDDENNDILKNFLFCKTAHRIAITKIILSILFSESITDSFESHTKRGGESPCHLTLQHAVYSTQLPLSGNG